MNHPSNGLTGAVVAVYIAGEAVGAIFGVAVAVGFGVGSPDFKFIFVAFDIFARSELSFIGADCAATLGDGFAFSMFDDGALV